MTFMHQEFKVSFLFLTPGKRPWYEEPMALLLLSAPLISTTLGNEENWNYYIGAPTSSVRRPLRTGIRHPLGHAALHTVLRGVARITTGGKLELSSQPDAAYLALRTFHSHKEAKPGAPRVWR